jgi:hypothetical protein
LDSGLGFGGNRAIGVGVLVSWKRVVRGPMGWLVFLFLTVLVVVFRFNSREIRENDPIEIQERFGSKKNTLACWA